jgi:hypothetical protein
MAESVEIVSALLYVAANSSPFTGANAEYSVTQFKRGFQRESMETPTLALYEFGGPGQPQGLGTVDQYRSLTVRTDILADTRLGALRIGEKARAAWQADYNCEGGGSVGDVGNGYAREAGVKGLAFSEPRDAPWDETGRVARIVFDLVVTYRD